MSWSPTSKRNAVSALAALWKHQEWRDSPYAEAIRSTLIAMHDSPDEVNRLHAAQCVVSLEQDLEAGFEAARTLLEREQHPSVSTVLLYEVARFRNPKPEAVDAVLGTIVRQDPWIGRITSVESDSDPLDPLEPLTALALCLAIRHQTPWASALVKYWFSKPITTEAARRAIGGIRDWLALPARRNEERARAFTLLRTAIESLTFLLDAVENDFEAARRIHQVAHGIASDLYFASGAHTNDQGDPKDPEEGMPEEAFEALAGLAGFKEPSTTYDIVRTLGHLAPQNPARAFSLVAAAVRTGDRYTYDSMAASESLKLIERYIIEFRDVVVTDHELLTDIHSVLRAFVDAGWRQAIKLTYDLSEAFR